MANLVAIDGTTFELVETETLVGRGGRQSDDDPPKVDVGPYEGGGTVSSRHARIYSRSGQWYIRVEPTSRNRTLVGGRLIPQGEEAPLVDNMVIQLGDLSLTFRAPELRVDKTEIDVAPMADGAGTAEVPVSRPEEPSGGGSIAAAVAAVAQVGELISVQPPPTTGPPQTSANWVARLPNRPPTLAVFGTTEMKRVNPFRGLMIDEQAWADAHDYHRLQSRLHQLSTHGWGVVEGLEVVADPHVPNTLVVRPGIAVDSHGRALLVPQERRLTISTTRTTLQHVILRLHEELTQPQRFWSDVDEYTRVVERCELLVQEAPPTAPAIELARLRIQGPLRDAANPLNPRDGEIDLRFRERLAVRPRPELGVAQLAPGEGDTSAWTQSHLLGLRYLLREIALTTPYRPRWAGVFRLGEALPPASLLYLPGLGHFVPSGDAIGQLRTFLQNGGVVFADGCGAGKGAEFGQAIQGLASSLGCTLQSVTRGHPLLAARHIFSEAPRGGSDGSLSEGGGLVVSAADYGCAWQGGSQERPLAREAIRAALELGVNVAVYARQRQRPLEVLELEA